MTIKPATNHVGRSSGTLVAICEVADFRDSDGHLRHRVITVCCDCGKQSVLETNEFARRVGCRCGGKARAATLARRTRWRTPINYIGKSFSKLIVVAETTQVFKRSHLLLCVCECGNHKLVSAFYLTAQRPIKSCGCLIKENALARTGKSKASQLAFGEASFNALFKRYVGAAKVAHRVFELSRGQFREITSSRCDYCGDAPSQVEKRKREWFHGYYTYNGIDRLDPNQGYTIANSVPCCKTCNYGKHTKTAAEFRAHQDRVALYRYPLIAGLGAPLLSVN